MSILENYLDFENQFSEGMKKYANPMQIRSNLSDASKRIDDLLIRGYITEGNEDHIYLNMNLNEMRENSKVSSLNNFEGLRIHYHAYNNIEDVCRQIINERDNNE